MTIERFVMRTRGSKERAVYSGAIVFEGFNMKGVKPEVFIIRVSGPNLSRRYR